MPENKNEEQERAEQIARLVKAYEQRLKKSYPRTPQTIEQIERTAQEIGEQIKQDIQQQIVETIGDGQVGKQTRCGCGHLARYKGQATRRLLTLHGELLLVRAYYWCAHCRQGFCPLERLLGVGRGSTSVSVRVLACRFASLLPFAKAARELELVCGVHLSASTLARLAEQTGEEIAQIWQERQQRYVEQAEEARTRLPARLHISLDGVMAHVSGVWREVKLGVCYERGKQQPVHDHYTATLSPSVAFGKRLKTLSLLCGEGRCRQVAVVADGSAWVWQEAGKHYTQRVQILDFWHASQPLYLLAGARFAGEQTKQKSWVGVQQERLRGDRVASVIADITAWQPGKEAGQEVRRKVLGYLGEHDHRMRYQTFAEAGYHIGSGVMESSCRWVVQQRMKGAGMRWSGRGAESMLQLRCACCSHSQDDLLLAARRATLPV